MVALAATVLASMLAHRWLSLAEHKGQQVTELREDLTRVLAKMSASEQVWRVRVEELQRLADRLEECEARIQSQDDTITRLDNRTAQTAQPWAKFAGG